MSNYMPYNQNQSQNQTFQPYQASQFFPQPQGSIYMINTSNDISNVPVGAGLSAAICLREGIMYLKTIQNGSPMLLGYRLSSLEGADTKQEPNQNQETDKKIIATLKGYDERIQKIENQLNTIINSAPQTNANDNKGGIAGWQL